MKLKFVEEQKKSLDLAALEEKRRQLENTTICKFCGAEDSIEGSYRGITYGNCRIYREGGAIYDDDHEDIDWDPIEITQYKCVECGAEADDIDNLILEEGAMFEGVPLDDEGE
jgi:hypothetical protein